MQHAQVDAAPACTQVPNGGRVREVFRRDEATAGRHEGRQKDERPRHSEVTLRSLGCRVICDWLVTEILIGREGRPPVIEGVVVTLD